MRSSFKEGQGHIEIKLFNNHNQDVYLCMKFD